MIPNWKNKEAYPLPETTSNQQWAWEFLRRNKDYQAEWHKYISNGKIKPSHDYLFDTFGVINLCDPQIDYGNPSVLLLCFGEPPRLSIVTAIPEENENGDIEPPMDAITFAKKMQPQMLEEATIKFDVHYDIDSQIEIAREYLNNLLKCVHKKSQDFFPLCPSKSEEQFPLYLRLFDAESQSPPLKQKEFIELVLPVLAPREHKHSAIERLIKSLRQAKYWAKTGYKSLCLEKYRAPLSKAETKEFKAEILALNTPDVLDKLNGFKS